MNNLPLNPKQRDISIVNSKQDILLDKSENINYSESTTILQKFPYCSQKITKYSEGVQLIQPEIISNQEISTYGLGKSISYDDINLGVSDILSGDDLNSYKQQLFEWLNNTYLYSNNSDFVPFDAFKKLSQGITNTLGMVVSEGIDLKIKFIDINSFNEETGQYAEKTDFDINLDSKYNTLYFQAYKIDSSKNLENYQYFNNYFTQENLENNAFDIQVSSLLDGIYDISDKTIITENPERGVYKISLNLLGLSQKNIEYFSVRVSINDPTYGISINAACKVKIPKFTFLYVSSSSTNNKSEILSLEYETKKYNNREEYPSYKNVRTKAGSQDIYRIIPLYYLRFFEYTKLSQVNLFEWTDDNKSLKEEITSNIADPIELEETLEGEINDILQITEKAQHVSVFSGATSASSDDIDYSLKFIFDVEEYFSELDSSLKLIDTPVIIKDIVKSELSFWGINNIQYSFSYSYRDKHWYFGDEFSKDIIIGNKTINCAAVIMDGFGNNNTFLSDPRKIYFKYKGGDVLYIYSVGFRGGNSQKNNKIVKYNDKDLKDYNSSYIELNKEPNNKFGALFEIDPYDQGDQTSINYREQFNEYSMFLIATSFIIEDESDLMKIMTTSKADKDFIQSLKELPDSEIKDLMSVVKISQSPINVSYFYSKALQYSENSSLKDSNGVPYPFDWVCQDYLITTDTLAVNAYFYIKQFYNKYLLIYNRSNNSASWNTQGEELENGSQQINLEKSGDTTKIEIKKETNKEDYNYTIHTPLGCNNVSEDMLKEASDLLGLRNNNCALFYFKSNLTSSDANGTFQTNAIFSNYINQDITMPTKKLEGDVRPWESLSYPTTMTISLKYQKS